MKMTLNDHSVFMNTRNFSIELMSEDEFLYLPNVISTVVILKIVFKQVLKVHRTLHSLLNFLPKVTLSYLKRWPLQL